jgi:hypothetical protein
MSQLLKKQGIASGVKVVGSFQPSQGFRRDVVSQGAQRPEKQTRYSLLDGSIREFEPTGVPSWQDGACF